MKAKLTIEIDMKSIRKFAVLSDIELTREQEDKISSTVVTITDDMLGEDTGDDNAALVFAGIIVSNFLKQEEQ